MVPTLSPGDILLIRAITPTRARGIAPGALVVLTWPGLPLSVKRLLQVEPDGGWWVERDSATEGVDSFSHGAVPPQDCRGIVLARVWPRPTRLAPRSARRRSAGPGPG